MENGWIYAITCEIYNLSGLIKLGYTKGYGLTKEEDVRKKLISRYKVSLPEPSILGLIHVANPIIVEKILFDTLRCKKYRGEIYKCNYEIDIIPIFNELLTKYPKIEEQPIEISLTNTCKYCKKIFSREWNLKRHIETCIRKKDNINSKLLTNNTHLQDNINFLCKDCGKQYSSKRNLQVHQQRCDGIRLTITCKDCHKYFSSKQSLSNHKKICSVKKTESEPNKELEEIATKEIQTNIILKFPEHGEDFDFIYNKITIDDMKAVLDISQYPYVMFNNFIHKILEDPQNLIIRKTNPNVSYSMIHTGNGCWDYAYDKQVFPTLIHHMTRAALRKIEEIEKNVEAVRDLYNRLEIFKKYVFDINTLENEEGYKSIIRNLKLMIINVSRKS